MINRKYNKNTTMFDFLNWIAIKWANWNYKIKQSPTQGKKIIKKKNKKDVSPIFYI
tara:strand:+ start:186 stop:353 length:168 start_codon:yes stop_codon:yes gene_type:complete